MTKYSLKGLLQADGFQENVTVTVDYNGIILSISESEAGQSILPVYAIPGFQNAHSHAFQYAMAGLAERHATGKTPDDFWSWREAMYALALTIGPDDIENIAAMLYAEMLRHGYTNVAEFHYVHHDLNGKPYSNLSEMGERLISAAKRVGIGITLVPICYQKGGFGKSPTEGQKRFITTGKEEYLNLLQASEASIKLYANASLGIGMHSMRGVEPSLIADLAANGPQDIPFHIHVSEQLKEVEDSMVYLGKRPVQWMLDEIDMNDRFHLVHATHLDSNEIEGLANSGANVVLCPSTEGNLGDGIFPLRSFQKCGGNWSVGTDSHVGLNPFEELRILDYGQRLVSHKRNTYYSDKEGDAGMFAFNMALKTGRKAMNNYSSDFFRVGDSFNAVLMDANAPLIATSSLQNLPSTLLYCTDTSMQYGTISHGKMIVKEGKHVLNDEIKANFIKTMGVLGSRL